MFLPPALVKTYLFLKFNASRVRYRTFGLPKSPSTMLAKLLIQGYTLLAYIT